MFEEIFGLPMHPLAVHSPVVLLPIASVVCLVALARTSFRDRLGPWLTASVGVLVVMLFVARQSGVAVKNEAVGFNTIDRHEQLGNQTFVISIVWFAVMIGLTFRDRSLSGDTTASSVSAGPLLLRRDPATLALSAAALVMSVLALVWLIRTGHLGVEGRWG